MERKLKAIIIPKGYYIYLEKLYRATMKDDQGKEFDGEIEETEISAAIGGLIIEHEYHRGKSVEEAQQQLKKLLYQTENKQNGT